MALHKLVRSNYGKKLPVSVRYEFLLSFKEGVILLCQNILETRRISHLHGWALFTIPLRDCQQTTSITCNGFCLLKKKNHPLFLTDNIKMDRMPTKIKLKTHTLFTLSEKKIFVTNFPFLMDSLNPATPWNS